MPFLDRFVTRYLNPLEVEAEFDRITASFPALCRMETLPLLSHGYQGARVDARGRHPTRVLRITAPGGGTKPGVLLMRSHHAREWINALAVVETARQLVENFRPGDPDARVQQVVRALQGVEFFIVPESNPDGARLSFFDAGREMWRKNLRPPEAGGNCPGVDCNRNFPQFFGEAGSSPAPCADIFHGPSPLSEPEAANIALLVARHRNIIFAVDSHSHGQAIFRPSPTGGSFTTSEPISPEDDAIYRHLEDRMNAAIVGVQGVRYATGSTSNHAGTTDEFFFFTHRIFGFDLECGLHFQPPESDAVAAALEVAEAVKALGLCAAGETGLDVGALVARRPAAPVDVAAMVDSFEAAGTGTWDVEPLPPEKWRRFRVLCEPLPGAPVPRQLEELSRRGFDATWRPASKAFEIIASAGDLEELVRMGYPLRDKQDLQANRVRQDAPGSSDTSRRAKRPRKRKE